MISSLERKLREKIVGQDTAIAGIARAVQVALSGLSDNRKPSSVMMLLGPSGVGKTETAKALAYALHLDPGKYIYIPCESFSHSHEVARLIGAPPGYLGHRETKPLLSAQSIVGCTSINCDKTIILFDEIEKAHQSLHVLLLGILDEAKLLLGDNNTVGLTNSIIIMTSNVGSSEITKYLTGGMGFSINNKDINYRGIQSIGLNALKSSFKHIPEFLNRIPNKFVYGALTKEDYSKIAKLEFSYVLERLRRSVSNSFELAVEEEVINFLVKNADNGAGARSIKQLIENYVIQELGLFIFNYVENWKERFPESPSTFMPQRLITGAKVIVEDNKIVTKVNAPKELSAGA